ncbi:MAG TPA: pyridoxal-phosphate dependent enzyme [Brevibacterium senegalense]|uniref:Pyridoxal-phosphate dependent enzyme n=1 Tax=Brevibacterium senegalense TaxID=1033736 RepID=A0A921MF34_9MICO|nr:pyridoxal-phosphate dependent enzyme [Brevibacterium senegalense]
MTDQNPAPDIAAEAAAGSADPAPAAVLARPQARAWTTEAAPTLLDFHRSIPGYAPTRLVELPALARELGADRVWVKEESARYGLPAFKMLGAGHAIARALSARLGTESRESAVLPFDEIAARVQETGVRELVAATDGNHGRAVAHTAALVGLPARIFLPAGVSEEAIAGIRSEGATATVLDLSYDDVVAHAAQQAEAEGSLLVQDTSWAGYEEIPAWIVEGYGTVLTEAAAQLADAGAPAPTLVTAPTGVGAFAEAVVRFARSGGFAGVEEPAAVTGAGNPTGTSGAAVPADGAPQVVTAEPDVAACLQASLRADEPVSVETGHTIMAGLNCGTVAASSWPVLHAGVDLSAVVTDAQTAKAVRDLEAMGVDSGPCGASSLAAVRVLRENGLLEDGARILLLSTEGRAANPLPEELT